MRVTTLSQAAKFIDSAGFAYVFPDNRMPLPSLWGAVCGNPRREMDEDDWGWTKAVERTWGLKNDLGAERSAFFGRYFRGKGSLISLGMLPALHAARRSDDPLSPDAKRAFERLSNVGAMSTLRLRESLGLHGSKGHARFDKITVELYRRLLIATVGTDDTETRWPSGVIDTFKRAFPDVVRSKVVNPVDALVTKFRATSPEATDRQIASLLGIRL